MKKRILPIMLAFSMTTGLMPGISLAAETGNAEVRYSIDSGKSWTEAGLLDALVNPADSVQIELLQDITLTVGNWKDTPQAIAGTQNSKLAIDGKGHTIKRGSGIEKGLFSANGAGSVVTLRNITIDGGAEWQGNDPVTRTNKGAVSLQDSSLFYVSGGATVVLGNGAVLQNNDTSGNDAAAAVTAGSPDGAGTLVMDNGSQIKNNSAKNGTVVYIYNENSTFQMNGGEIYGNYASSGKGTVYNKGTFEINGGKIHDNAGGVISVHNGTLSIPGKPLIEGNNDGTITGITSVTGITLDTSSLTFTSAGESRQLVASVVPDSATNKNVTWVSGNTNVATVDANGNVTAVSNGTCTVTAITEDGNIMAVCNVTVNIPAAEPTVVPTTEPTVIPTAIPTTVPTIEPTAAPAITPSAEPTIVPTTPADLTFIPDEVKKINAIALNSGLETIQTGNKINITWGIVDGAEGYNVYVQYCGKNFNSKSLNSVNSGTVTKTTIKEVNGKALDKTKNYKVYVTAYKTVNGQEVTLGKSIVSHFAGSKNKKYTNAKSINLDNDSYNLVTGGTAQINASVVLADKNKEQFANHTSEFRYATDDSTVATVSASGEISATGTGSCTVYVYAKNGCAKKINVTVD